MYYKYKFKNILGFLFFSLNCALLCKYKDASHVSTWHHNNAIWCYPMIFIFLYWITCMMFIVFSWLSISGLHTISLSQARMLASISLKLFLSFWSLHKNWKGCIKLERSSRFESWTAFQFALLHCDFIQPFFNRPYFLWYNHRGHQ